MRWDRRGAGNPPFPIQRHLGLGENCLSLFGVSSNENHGGSTLVAGSWKDLIFGDCAVRI